MRTPISTLLSLFAASLLDSGAAHGATAQQKCDSTRLKAKAKYERCVDEWVGKSYSGKPAPIAKLVKCRAKYSAAWPKLQKLIGTTCAQARFNDNGDGTILDRLTGLYWEKKGDDSGVHDVDVRLTWSAGGPKYFGDGTAFTTFLTTQLNTPGFASAHDWRLPSFAELQTILRPVADPCGALPCVESAFDNGCMPGCDAASCSCTASAIHWSATDVVGSEDWAWAVDFFGGGVLNSVSKANNNYAVRAVRGGS